jgi:hypothetical protein
VLLLLQVLGQTCFADLSMQPQFVVVLLLLLPLCG